MIQKTVFLFTVVECAEPRWDFRDYRNGRAALLGDNQVRHEAVHHQQAAEMPYARTVFDVNRPCQWRSEPVKALLRQIAMAIILGEDKAPLQARLVGEYNAKMDTDDWFSNYPPQLAIAQNDTHENELIGKRIRHHHASNNNGVDLVHFNDAQKAAIKNPQLYNSMVTAMGEDQVLSNLAFGFNLVDMDAQLRRDRSVRSRAEGGGGTVF